MELVRLGGAYCCVTVDGLATRLMCGLGTSFAMLFARSLVRSFVRLFIFSSTYSSEIPLYRLPVGEHIDIAFTSSGSLFWASNTLKSSHNVPVTCRALILLALPSGYFPASSWLLRDT